MKQPQLADPSKERVWEVDAFRGFLILAVLINHLNITVNAFCINGYYQIDSAAWARFSDPLGVWYKFLEDGSVRSADWVKILRETCTRPAVSTFFIVSGISCTFSRNNLRRGLIMLASAFVVAGFTKLLAVWTNDPKQFIRFGVLHCYAYSHLIYYFLLEKSSKKTLLIAAIPILLLGYYLRYFPVYSEYALLVPFGVYERDVPMWDYWPLFPMLGWMLIGVVLGKSLYLEKKSLWPCQTAMRLTRPLQWLGRHSGQIYLAHIFLYTAVFCGIGWMFGLF